MTPNFTASQSHIRVKILGVTEHHMGFLVSILSSFKFMRVLCCLSEFNSRTHSSLLFDTLKMRWMAVEMKASMFTYALFGLGVKEMRG